MTQDLVVLVADIQQEKVVDTLLRERHQSLGMRPITFNILRHPEKDPGVYHRGADLLEVGRPLYDHALVFIDCEWDGVPGDATHLRQHILQRLHSMGWPRDRCEVIAIEPELEAWVWTRSPHVPAVLRMSWDDMRMLGQRHGYWRLVVCQANYEQLLLGPLPRGVPGGTTPLNCLNQA